jgi:hypothetical protein
VAASLAQDDQERMRGLQPSELSRQRTLSRTVTVAGVPYTVVSRVRPEADTPAGTSGCTSSGRGFDYLKIVSEVTWPHMRGVDPVRADSLVASKFGAYAPDEGGLAVQIRDRDGGPQSGISVAASGPASDSDTTDEHGCAFFAALPQGNYTLAFAKTGYVTPSGSTSVSQTASVTAGAVNSVAFDYDVSGQINVSVRNSAGTAGETADGSIVAAHTLIPAPGALLKPFPSAGPLYPFKSPYAVYSGCVGSAPAAPPTVALAPGGSPSVTVTEPTVSVQITNGPPAAASGGAPSAVWLLDKTCSTGMKALVRTSGGASSGTQTWTRPAPNVGLPYGSWLACARKGTKTFAVAFTNTGASPSVTVALNGAGAACS